MSKQIECPKCKSLNVVPLGQERKGFSVGKTLGGVALAGPIGSLAGFIGKKGKYQFYCQDCGRRFEHK